MIIENQNQVTEAVLAEIERIENPRMREIAAAAVRHLHAFAREVKLTEDEYIKAVRCGLSRATVLLKRDVSSAFINGYNNIIADTWAANMVWFINNDKHFTLFARFGVTF